MASLPFLPAVLHSICALTARFLGGVVVLDPADFQVLRARANREHSKNELDALGPKVRFLKASECHSGWCELMRLSIPASMGRTHVDTNGPSRFEAWNR